MFNYSEKKAEEQAKLAQDMLKTDVTISEIIKELSHKTGRTRDASSKMAEAIGELQSDGKEKTEKKGSCRRLLKKRQNRIDNGNFQVQLQCKGKKAKQFRK